MWDRTEILRKWAAEAPIYFASLVPVAFCIALLSTKGIYPEAMPVWVNARLFFISVVAMLCIDATVKIVQDRPVSPIAYLRTRYTSPEVIMALVGAIPLFIMSIAIIPFFSKMKAAIPLFNPYSWDQTFIAWDQAIFFGYDAWEVLQPLLGFPIITAFLAVLYHLWMLLLYPGCLFFLLANIDETVRRKFFLSYALSWFVVGGLMATALSSVGPVFLGPIMGDGRFDDQMLYLNGANEQITVLTISVQEMLLEWHFEKANGIGSGITAMPSMHCAIAFLFWLAMRQVSKPAGIFFGAFFAITWVSSVHLAYHYAVDGLVSLIAVAIIWKLSGAVITGWDALLARRNQPAFRTNTVPAE
ncbi:MAG: phosphatase PAP2 family protein [Erythrobacter sp.]